VRRGGTAGLHVFGKIRAKADLNKVGFLFFASCTPPRRHRSLQYFTASHVARHFFRHVIGLPHRWHIFVVCGRILLVP
jgi:hypothetical protein